MFHEVGKFRVEDVPIVDHRDSTEVDTIDLALLDAEDHVVPAATLDNPSEIIGTVPFSGTCFVVSSLHLPT